MRQKIGVVLLLLGLLFIPVQPVAAVVCVQNPAVRVEVTRMQDQISSITAAYQVNLQNTVGQLRSAMTGLEKNDRQIRGQWQGNADRRFLQEMMEDQVRQLTEPILNQIAQDAHRYEADLQAVLDRPLNANVPRCTRVSLTRSLRVSVPTQTYSGTTTWRDGWGKIMAQYRVQVTVGARVTGGQSVINVNGQTQSYRARLNIQPSIRIRSHIQSKRRDRSSVQLQKELAGTNERVQINLQGRVQL